MAFRDFAKQGHGVPLLQRSLARGRLAHGYLFTGDQVDDLEVVARTLAKTLNCQHPRREGNAPVDCCDQCLSCRKIEHGNHGDVHWIRPESKSRIIKIDEIRELNREIQLKPAEAEYKVAVIVAADRLKTEAANAFLKTLEEPPPRSILILLTTDPQRLLETILSRCLRINFAGEGPRQLAGWQKEWLASFSATAAATQKSLLSRYRLLDVLLAKLAEMKASIEQTLQARSPLEQFPDAEKDLQEKWEDELAAAKEAEYRRQRADVLALLHWWLRDVWLCAVARERQQENAGAGEPNEVERLLSFPEIEGARPVGQRISGRQARENLEILEQLQRRLGTNVQEALALEVSLLKLRL